VRVLTAAGDDLTATDDPFKKAMRQIAGAFAELEKVRSVAKLRHARDRIRNERGKWEGRKTRIERAERGNNPDLVKSLTQAVEMAKRLRRASPKTGERRSLRKISAELAAAGNFNERGRPFNPNSVRLMLEG
jgi:DNA invertase Pin-like site-specific DNA recombinase